MASNKRWIQKIRNMKKGKVRNYIKRKYGNKAFTENDTIKNEYLHKAIKSAKNESIKRALYLALNLKKISRKKR